MLAELVAEASDTDGTGRAVVISAIEGTAGIGKTTPGAGYKCQAIG